MKLLKTLIGAGFGLTLCFSAQAEEFPTDKQLMAVCVAVVLDDVSQFNAAIDDMTSVVMQVKRKDVMNYVMNAKNFACNGQDLAQFISSHNAMQIATLLGEDDKNLQLASNI